MRKTITLVMVVGGFALQIVSYFFLASPLGAVNTAAAADPRLPFAPLIFIIGIALVFLAAVVYEVMPEARGK
jgi:H+/Cl- antiporter ClcA